MSSGFTKTTLIECNRTQSDEALTNNNENTSQWTNRVGTGLHLKPGDQITVHSSFISEIGAESGQIQIKGVDLGQTVEVETTEFQKSLFFDDLPQKWTLVNCSNKKQTISVRDDTLNLLVSPYKCAQGDNYVFLPRRYGGSGATQFWRYYEKRDGGAVTATYDTGQTHNPPRPLNRCSSDLSEKYWPYLTGKAAVSKRITGINDGSRFTLFTRTQTFYGEPNSTAYTLTGQASAGSPIIKLTHGASTLNLLVGMQLIAQSPDTVFPVNSSIISIHDHNITMNVNASANTNSHNLFTFQVSSSLSDAYLPPTTVNSGYSADKCESLRDPAIWGADYIQVKNLISLRCNPGYNSPTDLADQLTEEINERTDLEFFEYNFRNASNTQTQRETITFKTESPAYKMYNCATSTNFSRADYNEWIKTNGTWNVNHAYHYLSSYQHIALKRPELYITGKLLNASVGNNTNYFHAQTLGDQIFVTSDQFTEENLQKYKQFFDAQATYPELFNYTQNGIAVNSNTARFIHMNLYDNESDPDSLINPSNFGANIKSPKTPPFGYDLYNNTVSASQTSFPLFIDYNPDTANLTPEDVSYADFGTGTYSNGSTLLADYDQLVYGFARKVKTRLPVFPGGVYYRIGFQFTQTGNKIPNHFFHTNACTGDAELGTGGGRKYGFDRHFTAYGTLAMMLWNGNSNEYAQAFSQQAPWKRSFNYNQCQTEKEYYQDQYMFGLYLGADEPIINYDNDQQRFQISNLHTAEVKGQVGDAGFSQTLSTPDDPDSGDPCYKINKRPLRVTYTPELVPYTDSYSTSYTGGSSNTYVAHNPGIEPYTIMDAQSGLFVEDWCVPENIWDESLIGIMGYRYNQFHNPNSLSSRQVRIKAHGANADLHNVNIITTNANVNEGDLMDYIKNPVGSNMNYPVNTIMSAPMGGGLTIPGRMITPAITISPVESVKITAERLPSKTLRPYYTIRSDILSEQNAVIGGPTSGVTMPIVAIVNKANPYADFLNGFTSQITFTNTIDRVITRIRCSIHESDGTFARTDPNSAVIFKIDQQVPANLNLVQTLLQSKLKSDQQIAQEAEDPQSGLELIKYTKDIFE